MKYTKTFEEFIGDETVDSLRKKAEKIQQKDKVFLDPSTQSSDNQDGEPDDDSSGDEMGSSGGDE